MSALLEVHDLVHSYRKGGQESAAIGNVSFTVEAGELSCIVGPSGCGKSTLLRVVAGLIKPTSGDVLLHGEPVTGVPRDLAVVFQDYSKSLYPWLSVNANVRLPLRPALSRAECRARADEALEWVGLDKVGKKYPWELSGGMQQRVSIARALAYRPALMLMDEPFASVDAQTRAELEDLLLRVRAEHNMTVLVVTHDIDESVYLADHVNVLSSAPSTIVKTIKVDLPAERDQITTRELGEFVHLRGEVARLLQR